MVELEDIRLARRRLQGVAVHTPLVLYPRSVPERLLYFKPESFQPIGSFKVHGAYNKIASLSEEKRRQGIIAYSSGNHAQGVAYAGHKLGVQATIVMPYGASQAKLQRTAALGAEIVPVGASSEERRVRAEKLADEYRYALVPPYNDEALIAGQGTAGLEILEDLPDVEMVLVPVGGGGLISGVAAALKLRRPDIHVMGVEPELAADAQASLRSGRIVELTSEQAARTIADGLRTQHLGDITFAYIRRFVDDIVAVSEDEIIEAMRRLAYEAKLVTEPSGAVAFAGYLFRQNELPSARLNIALISGGNIEPSLLTQILAESASNR
jgi:threonine dehydratase